MLGIHSDAIQCCAAVGRIVSQVERRDGALANQMRRAIASVALNISEGSGSQGENRNARYFNALGSAREVGTALEVAVAFGYVARVDESPPCPSRSSATRTSCRARSTTRADLADPERHPRPRAALERRPAPKSEAGAEKECCS